MIRRRVAARTTAIHVSAIAGEPWAQGLLADADSGGYLQQHSFPEKSEFQDLGGRVTTLSREEAWRHADSRAAALEWTLLSGVTGRIAAFFSVHGQGIYANYGRPTMDFSGFFWDRVKVLSSAQAAAAASGTSALGKASAVGGLRVGPMFIAADTAAASGLTALGHVARGASLANPAVASDIFSTGAYEGTSAWVSAKLGVITGVKAMAFAAALPLAGAPLAALVAGFTVGAATAIAVKQTTNHVKDKAIDAVHRPSGAQVATDRRFRHA